jgi:outer membrane protein TolC
MHRTMKCFSVVLIVFSLALAVRAQTDTNALAATVPANAVSATVDTNAVSTMADTNAPVLQPDTNTVVAPTNAAPAVMQTDTNAAASPVETNAPAPPPDTNATAAWMGGGGGAATRSMSLEDCIQEALQHNLDVQIERTVPQISLYNLRAAYSGYDPAFNFSGQHSDNVFPGGGFNQFSTNPIPARITKADSFNSGLGGTLPWGLQYTFSGNIADTLSSANPESTSGQIGVSLTQPLLKNFWIDNTRLTIRVNKNRLKFSEQSLRSQFIVSITAVENAYYELIYAQENVKVQQEALRLAQTQLDQDNQRVQIGTIAERAGTIEQDEAQVASSQASLIAAYSTLGTDQRALKYLLTDQYSKWLDTDIQPTATLTANEQAFDLQESWRKGMTERPDLLQARLNVEQQGIQLKFYRNQLFPELDLIGTYGFNGASKEYSGTFNQFNEGNSPFYSYGAQLSLPLANVGPRNQYKSNKAMMQQLVLQLKQLEQNVMVEIDNDIGVGRSDFEKVKASRQARIYAEAALDAEQKKYAVGKSTTFTVLQLQNTLTTDRGAEIRALADYHEALTALAKDEGSTLERDKIDIQAK